jgi:hypothetical protein
VRRGPETVKAQLATRLNAGEAERAETDDSRTQKRRCLLVGEILGNGVHKAFRGEGELGISSVHDITCERGVVAEVLLARAAIFTVPTGVVQPGYPDTVAYTESADVGTYLLDPAHHLVPWDNR